MSWNNFASWDQNDDKLTLNQSKDSLLDMQFNEDKKIMNHKYSRDDINDKIKERGWISSTQPFNSETNNNINNNNFIGRLDTISSTNRVQQNDKNSKNEKNTILDHQFFSNRGEYKYSEPIKTINSRNLNTK